MLCMWGGVVVCDDVIEIGWEGEGLEGREFVSFSLKGMRRVGCCDIGLGMMRFKGFMGFVWFKGFKIMFMKL